MLDAYRVARERASSLKIAELLRKLNYAYPYHQAIGFYLHAAGHPPQDQVPFASIGTEYEFYPGHGLRHSLFDKTWRVFYPRGLRHKAF